MSEEALKLADKADGMAIEIPADWSSGEPKNVMTDIADMIRKLVAENDNLFKALLAEQEHNEMLVAELDKQEKLIKKCANIALQGTGEPIQTNTLNILKNERQRIHNNILKILNELN